MGVRDPPSGSSNATRTFYLTVEWATAPASAKRAHVEVLLESLEHKDADIRLANIRKLLYIIQGVGPSHSLHVTCSQRCLGCRDFRGVYIS